ncbi:DUF2953 domain-containing protein [Desulfolucanica intricata]|uniref:DUF2953 domain-containing protein n=1 Tax=Desulfolucanica intricata TaxID=1285191 RepID=UPI00082B325D|nr:DUF2953 domain-containing protein [Desulfolucanica intricata]
MVLFLTLVLVMLFILLIVSLSSIRFRLRYLREKNNDRIKIEISVFKGKLKYRLDIPKINVKTKEPSIELEAELEGVKKPPISDKHKNYLFIKLYKEFVYWYPIMKDFIPVINFLLKKVIPRKVKWKTEIGLFDAAQTGVSVGILWAMKSALLSNAYRYMARAPNPPNIQIVPHFNQKILTINIDCIFDVKIGYIMITGLKCLKIIVIRVILKIFCLLRGEFGGRTTTSN